MCKRMPTNAHTAVKHILYLPRTQHQLWAIKRLIHIGQCLTQRLQDDLALGNRARFDQPRHLAYCRFSRLKGL